jgi:hypothetical protein
MHGGGRGDIERRIGGFTSSRGGVKPPLHRQQITVPMHTVLLAARVLLRHFGLSPLLIARVGQLYPRESNFPTSIFDVRLWVDMSWYSMATFFGSAHE